MGFKSLAPQLPVNFKKIKMPHTVSQKVLLNTPIGALSFEAKCKIGKLDGSTITVHNWEPSIPNGMSVEGCNVIVFKHTTSEPLKDFCFSCEWVDLNLNGYGNSGEALDAWEWEYDKKIVLVGTEDSEWLNSRLNIKKEYTPENYPITMENNRISIKIDQFNEKKELTLHYVVAWNSLPEPKDSSCWFAVDVPHSKILEIIK